MNLQQRKELLARCGNYMLGNDEEWLAAKRRATAENPWFLPEFVDLAIKNIADNFLQKTHLNQLEERYRLPPENLFPKKVGIVMAGNIPLVGFHDLLCVFITGHRALVKLSSKDQVLLKQLVKKLVEWEPAVADFIIMSERIPNCDAYIATGSNNSSRYFEYYFQKYPSIIRKNRTSVAVLTGNESKEDLERLADDVFLHFGLGCRNVTQLYVPRNYDFVFLLEAFKKYHHLINHNKYKNNYDYNLAIHILNNTYYMTNEHVLLIEDPSPFSPISQLNYQFYSDEEELKNLLSKNENIQCVVSSSTINFGAAQCPGIFDYADGVDTIAFLLQLTE
jgi:hypothetical protein